MEAWPSPTPSDLNFARWPTSTEELINEFNFHLSSLSPAKTSSTLPTNSLHSTDVETQAEATAEPEEVGLVIDPDNSSSQVTASVLDPLQSYPLTPFQTIPLKESVEYPAVIPTTSIPFPISTTEESTTAISPQTIIPSASTYPTIDSGQPASPQPQAAPPQPQPATLPSSSSASSPPPLAIPPAHHSPVSHPSAPSTTNRYPASASTPHPVAQPAMSVSSAPTPVVVGSTPQSTPIHHAPASASSPTTHPDQVANQEQGEHKPVNDNKGGMIALIVLSVFFVGLIAFLLHWRSKRRKLKKDRQEQIAKMEETMPELMRKPASGIVNLGKESVRQEGLSMRLSEKQDGDLGSEITNTNNQFSTRGIIRAGRPSSLKLEIPTSEFGLPDVQGGIGLGSIATGSTTRGIEPGQNMMNSRDQRRLNPRNSWRSSIAVAWAQLGIPTKLLIASNDGHDDYDEKTITSSCSTLHDPYLQQNQTKVQFHQTRIPGRPTRRLEGIGECDTSSYTSDDSNDSISLGDKSNVNSHRSSSLNYQSNESDNQSIESGSSYDSKLNQIQLNHSDDYHSDDQSIRSGDTILKSDSSSILSQIKTPTPINHLPSHTTTT